MSAPRHSGFDRANPRADVFEVTAAAKACMANNVLIRQAVHSPLGMDDGAVSSRTTAGLSSIGTQDRSLAVVAVGSPCSAAPMLPTTHRTLGSLVPLSVEL